MNIKVRIDSFKPIKKGICAEVTLTLYNEICIHRVKVCNGDGGLYIAFPYMTSFKNAQGKCKFVDLVHPVNKETRNNIEKAVLKVYNERLNS